MKSEGGRPQPGLGCPLNQGAGAGEIGG